MAFDILVESTEGLVSANTLKSGRILGTTVWTSTTGSGTAPVGFDRANGGMAFTRPNGSSDTRLIPSPQFTSARAYYLAVPPVAPISVWCNDFTITFVMVE
jgi:hypothetical protein